MLTVLTVVAPIFGLVALGFVAVRVGAFPRVGVAGLIAFVNNFATPCLLFRAMLEVDFGTAFDAGVIVPFYAGGLIAFAVGIALSRFVFGRRPGEAVSSGFSAMFTNTVLLGIPISQRAFGDAAMPIVYSIVGFHATILLTLGMLTMELVRRDGGRLGPTLLLAARRIATNPLLLGIVFGMAGNVAGVTLVEPVDAFTLMMAQAVIPAALFGLGGALNEYRLRDSWGEALAASAVKLALQPAIAWVLLVPVLRVDPDLARYVVVLAAMPTGINAYIFATYYNRAVDVAANTILIGTVLSVITTTTWLYLMTL